MKAYEAEIRVRYQETDNMGVVYYGNYFIWFEVARTEYFRSLGLVYRDLEAKGVYLMVAAASCQYKCPARYDDLIKIETWVSELKNTSLKFEYKLYAEGKLIAAGDSLHVFTNKSGKPTKMPEEIRAICGNS